MNLSLGFVVAFFCAVRSSSTPDKDACQHCKFMVETFKMGLKKTANKHFGGGNTDWEERKLGTFKTSETRFIEIMEHVCKKDNLEDSHEFSSVKDLQFKCNHLAEEVEETLENWFFKRQDTQPDLYKFICIDEVRKCCPPNHYGPNCVPCPGALKGSACFNRGKCHGDGTRAGTGKCDCERGYAGVRCSACAAHFYETQRNDSYVACAACFDGCATTCTDATPSGCTSCRSGYRQRESVGCVDIDECAEADPGRLCEKEHELCTNTPGSYNCECKEGYRRDFGTDECILDVHAAPYDGFWRPDRMLRMCALLGLAAVAGFVLLLHRSTLALLLLAAALALVALIERNVDESWIPDEAKKLLARLV